MRWVEKYNNRLIVVTVECLVDHLVCKVINKGEDNGVKGGLGHQGSTRREREKNTRSQQKEEQSNKRRHHRVKHDRYTNIK